MYVPAAFCVQEKGDPGIPVLCMADDAGTVVDTDWNCEHGSIMLSRRAYLQRKVIRVVAATRDSAFTHKRQRAYHAYVQAYAHTTLLRPTPNPYEKRQRRFANPACELLLTSTFFSTSPAMALSVKADETALELFRRSNRSPLRTGIAFLDEVMRCAAVAT